MPPEVCSPCRMEGYSLWLALLAAAILSASIMQMQARAGHRLALDCRRLKSEIDLLQGRLREKEARIDRLQRNLAELKAAKQPHECLSAARLHFLEASLALH